MQMALEDAGLSPAQIGHVNAHGTSTPLNDAAEAEAIRKVFGDTAPPVTSTKGVTGHLVGAAGATEAVACVLAMRERLVPPTANLERLGDDIHLDVVVGRAPRARSPCRRCRTRSGSAATTSRSSSLRRRDSSAN